LEWPTCSTDLVGKYGQHLANTVSYWTLAYPCCPTSFTEYRWLYNLRWQLISQLERHDKDGKKTDRKTDTLVNRLSWPTFIYCTFIKLLLVPHCNQLPKLAKKREFPYATFWQTRFGKQGQWTGTALLAFACMELDCKADYFAYHISHFDTDRSALESLIFKNFFAYGTSVKMKFPAQRDWTITQDGNTRIFKELRTKNFQLFQNFPRCKKGPKQRATTIYWEIVLPFQLRFSWGINLHHAVWCQTM